MDPHALKGRLEDRRYVTGSGSFTADRSIAGQLHAHFLRSERPHAQIVSIDISGATATPGVHAVLTGEDIKAAGINALPTNKIAAKSRDGSDLIKTYRPAIAQSKVRYVGEPVACVIADSARTRQTPAEKM